MKDIITVVKKEIRSFFSDKAILLQMFILPFAFVFGYSMLMSTVADSEDDTTLQSEKSFVSYSINAPEEFNEVLTGLNISPAPDDDIEEYKNQIKDKKTDLLVVFPNKFTISDSTTSQLSNIDIFYNSDKSSSMEMYSRVIFQFTNMQPRLFTFNEISDEKYDLFDVNAMTRKFLGGIIPFVVFLSEL